MTYREITVPARDLHSGDFINGARVTRVDLTTNRAIAAVWIGGNDSPRADMMFNHGDPVRIERSAPVIVRDPGEDMADRWNETHS